MFRSIRLVIVQYMEIQFSRRFFFFLSCCHLPQKFKERGDEPILLSKEKKKTCCVGLI